ncbi:MAG: aminopeptidase N, partial [Xanthomonadales bacterium]|nr:aminopeptidase N [Xanthomonadales bacterium]
MSVTEPERAVEVRLADYRPPPWSIDDIDLVFDLGIDATTVRARLQVRRCGAAPGEPLRLDGEGLELLGLAIDGVDAVAGAYRLAGNVLEIDLDGDRANIETRVRIAPSTNHALQGLYLSGDRETGFLLTQCEAEGFRRITFGLDRPDVLSRYRVELRAARERFPVLLAGGNADGHGELAGGRHWVRFVDPQPKPSYLFALVAGRLDCIEDAWVTAEQRRVRLVIWAPATVVPRCRHAMESLKAAFAWDERRFGRCYRLDAFHVVATDDFTMGAMENTGLNIFNSKYLVADAERATDDDFRHVLAVVGHEYFHNWTGNRVTCRDWFQLSLKEGLTVYREQEFESDLASRTLRRIEDLRTLWRVQFGEDAGPLAHPVRPDRYTEINNFYTATVYEKGAEIVRMLATRLGDDGFRRGMDLYFERHDGAAVTVEDFITALGDANGCDLTPWLAWYRQAGTPVLEWSGRHDRATRRFALTLRQHTPPTPGQVDKQPLPIPVAFALFDHEGNRLAAVAAGIEGDVHVLAAAEQTLVFDGIDAAPVVSLLRGGSAPVRLAAPDDWRDLAVLARHETDGFNRWFCADALARRMFAEALVRGEPDAAALSAWIDALRAALDEPAFDPATLAEMLTVADEPTLAEPLVEYDPDAVHAARNLLERRLSEALEDDLVACHERLAGAAREGAAPAAQGRRRLRNRCLALLCRAGSHHHARAHRHYTQAVTLGDRLVALVALVHAGDPAAQGVLGEFAARHAGDPLVIDKWFAVQATAARADTAERVETLTRHALFRWENPNKVHALIGSFAMRNPSAFHRVDGAGYRLVGAAIARVDAL